MIISASRRTDIPAFYSEWFMNRIEAGFLLVRNPFNTHQVKRVSLLPNDVEAIVFWTRNAEKLLPHLELLDIKGYRYYFQYTITGYPRTIEKSVPQPLRAIETFSKVSEIVGSGRIVWRYDPILVSSIVDLAEHKRVFEKIASMLVGKTKRVVVSFADFYKKTERNLISIENFTYSDIATNKDAALELADFMARVATNFGMQIQSCAEKIDLSSSGIEHGKCVDDGLLQSEFGLALNLEKDNGQREECGCIKSVDIGQYNTCLHGCAYCYATFNEKAVVNNKKMHDPLSPHLVGGVLNNEIELLNPENLLQGSLFE
ncbi:MAG: DUF1848 domain-containing protein [Sideroxyarcus sp.]